MLSNSVLLCVTLLSEINKLAEPGKAGLQVLSQNQGLLHLLITSRERLRGKNNLHCHPFSIIKMYIVRPILYLLHIAIIMVHKYWYLTTGYRNVNRLNINKKSI
jgi:hypothetical protein